MGKQPAADDEARSIVAHLIGDNPNVIRWLTEIGLIVVDNQRQWQLTARAEAAIARPQLGCAERAPTAWLH